jgi:hypothetical protein
VHRAKRWRVRSSEPPRCDPHWPKAHAAQTSLYCGHSVSETIRWFICAPLVFPISPFLSIYRLIFTVDNHIYGGFAFIGAETP